MIPNWPALLAKSLLGGAALAALGGGAVAQTAAQTPAKSARPDATTVGEVIVTAQHRQERLRDVPISIISRTADQLDRARVSKLEDLQSVAAGVRIDDAGEYLQPSIRGIAATVIGPGTDAPVAIYLDGVYQSNQQTNHFEFADLARVEIDKGPQGTLYGRNATGGAIAIFTKAPSFTPSGDFELGYGNFNDVVGKGFVTGPIISDILAGSLSYYHESHEDYNYNVPNHKHEAGLNTDIVRGKLLFQPTSWAKFTLTGAYQERNDTDVADAVPLNGNTVARLDPSALIVTKPHDIAEDIIGRVHLKDYALTLNSQFDIPGWGVLTSISSGQYAWDYGPLDDDHSYNPGSPTNLNYQNIQKDHTYTEDLTFTSRKFGRFSFISGASYFWDDDAWAPIKVDGPNGTTVFVAAEKQPVESAAVFGEGTYDLTDRLTMVAGLRYSWEHRSINEDEYTGSGVQFAAGTGLPSVTFSAVTPRASLRYKVSDATNVYFTYSQGFKSGGISAATTRSTFTNAITPGATYQPEKISAYEVGLKTAISPRVSLNASAYYYDYTNLQVQIDLNTFTKVIENAASARIYGLDLDGAWRVTDEFTLNAGLAYTNARYVKYPGGDILVAYANLTPQEILHLTPQGSSPATTSCLYAPVANCDVQRDATGKSLPRSPELTFTLTGDYKKAFNAGVFDVNASLYYSSKIYFDSDQQVSQAPYATLAAQASWQPAGTKFKFEVWGKNITNTTYLVSVYEDTQSYAAGYAAAPTYGVAIKYSF